MKATLRHCNNQLQKLVKAPFSYQSIVRDKKDLSVLVPKGGHAERTLQLAQSIILPVTLKDIHIVNTESGL